MNQKEASTFEGFGSCQGSCVEGKNRKGLSNFATPEKALLDLLYLRGQIPFRDELELGDLDLEKLQEFSQKFPKTVQKKLALPKP